MITPRSTLTRRVVAALDASPSRIPVLLGGCGSGRTTLLHQLRDRIGRTTSQYINVERAATTPERFLRAVIATSPFPVGDAAPSGARMAFESTLALFNRTGGSGGEPATFLLDEFLELRTFESFPGLRRVLHDLVNDLSPPSRLSDTSWIKPGRASWSWWSQDDSPKHAEALNRFVDLADDMGWEYSLVDANWNFMETGKIEDVVAHARAKDIGLLFWYNSGGPHNDVTEAPRDRMHLRDDGLPNGLHGLHHRGAQVEFSPVKVDVAIDQF